jgi:NADPH:quinone reductase-like Zn-dependent oxidoreductase
MTAWYALFELAHPRRGAKVLVHSAAGGVGSALVQMLKRVGADVTGVVGRTAKVEVVKALGADHVIDKSTSELWSEAERIAPKGFDLILDANGVSTLGQSFRHLSRPGKLVIYGFASMLPKTGGKPSWPKLALDYVRTPRFNPLDLTNESKSLLAFNLSYLFERTELLAEAIADIVAWLEKGEIAPPQVTTYPLAEVARAHADIESGKTTGKLVLVP